MLCVQEFFLFIQQTYGIMADNVINARFVDNDGQVFALNDIKSPNLYSYTKKEMPLPGICVELTTPLHSILEDERGFLVPFETIEQALDFSRDISMRRIGTAIGILGLEYISSFIAPTKEIDSSINKFLRDSLGLQCMVLVIGTKHDRKYIESNVETIIDNEQFTSLMLGLPMLLKDELKELLESYNGNKSVLNLLFQKNTFPIIEAALNPSAELYASTVDNDLKSFFISLYNRPEMTDLVWLNSFRILSARLGRKKHVVAFILYVPLDKPGIIISILEAFSDIAGQYEIDNKFGFITPLDFGKRAVLEYDYFLDHRSNEERDRMRKAMEKTAAMIEDYSVSVKGISWIKYVFRQGIARKESMLYGTSNSF